MDDNGYWDTNKNWAFANTMLATDFRSYMHSEDDWRGPKKKDFKTTRKKGISADIFRTYYNWNQWMSNKGQAQNLVKLVVANSYIKKSGGASLNTRTVANVSTCFCVDATPWHSRMVTSFPSLPPPPAIKPNNIMDTSYQYCYFASLNVS